eukprot:GHVL01012350.1.p1 GENE.GHVL01012350.1~~GHVL01012350.1.p1  ORF type:complete len:387 (+),score=96.93 GHVL01012350.1:47-1207(+)
MAELDQKKANWTINDLKKDIDSNTVASQLRNRLRCELIQNIKTPGGASARRHQEDSNQSVRLAASLISDYLQWNDKKHTLSIILPDFGLRPKDLLSNDEIVDWFCFSVKPSSTPQGRALYATSRGGTSCLFICVLRCLREFLNKSYCNSHVQTEQSCSTLDEKLRALDNLYSEKRDGSRNTPHRSTEERMFRFQRETEQRIRREMESELERMRTIEMSSIRLEISSDCRREINDYKKEIEKSHKERLERLNNRENRAVERIKQQEADIQKKAFDMRQDLAAKMDSLQQKYEEKQRLLQIEADHVESKKMTMAAIENEIQIKKKQFEDLKNERDIQKSLEMENYKHQIENDFAEDRKKLHQAEMDLHKERHAFELSRVQSEDVVDQG